MNTRPLIVAPYIGEFGWELMNWQARVRWVLRRHAGHAIICGAPDRRVLYRDLLRENRVRFCPMPTMTWPGIANDDHRIDPNGDRIDASTLTSIVQGAVMPVLLQQGIDTRDASWLMPGFQSMIWPTTPAHQTFVNLRTNAAIQTDVLLVSRTRSHASERNQPKAWWDAIAERLRSLNFRVTHYAGRLDQAVEQLSTTRMAVGASTGGLHLASLCGCPHLVWGSGAESRWTSLQITNRQRYETIWNPLGTPCLYAEIGWQPDTETVIAAVRDAFERIALDPAGRPSRVLRTRWRVKRRLSGVMGATSGSSRWPWSVQQFVRKHLI